MSLSSRIRTWWRAVTRRTELNDQLDEELRFHIESYAEDLIRGGVPGEQALLRAKAEMGSIAARRENCRDAWGTRWFDELRGDLRYGLRMLAKSPGFALIAIGSLALGIGANTAIFSIAKRVLLDRLNVPHAEQLRLLIWTSNRNSAVHSIWGDWNNGYDGVYSTSFSYPVYEVLRNSNRGLEDLFAFKDAGRMDATIDGQAEVVQSELVSGNYYEQMQVRSQLGRPITPQDDRTGATPVAVISDEYWARRFNRAPSVIGRTVFLNLTSTTIIGVNPRGFTERKACSLRRIFLLPSQWSRCWFHCRGKADFWKTRTAGGCRSWRAQNPARAKQQRRLS
ncbi:MAG: ABC transporter permease [Acidobacteriaceae bacterium]|nr:ABC transporter permease [Acidobacteriaceae bacterium]